MLPLHYDKYSVKGVEAIKLHDGLLVIPPCIHIIQLRAIIRKLNSTLASLIDF